MFGSKLIAWPCPAPAMMQIHNVIRLAFSKCRPGRPVFIENDIIIGTVTELMQGQVTLDIITATKT